MKTKPLNPAIAAACMWFADGLALIRKYRTRPASCMHDYGNGRFSTARFILKAGITPRNRKQVGAEIAYWLKSFTAKTIPA